MANVVEANRRPTRREPRAKKTANAIVLVLCLIFLIFGISIALFHHSFNTEPSWILLIVVFSLSMSGALVLFHFLSSSAEFTKPSYRVGGAAAGFLVLFSTFYEVTKDSFLNEDPSHVFNQSEIRETLGQIASSFREIKQLRNEAIAQIAQNSLRNLTKSYMDLARGTYQIEANELPVHLLPLIREVKSRYYATQYVIPEAFWSQYWSKMYFDENIKAVKERNVDLKRIFILDQDEINAKKKIINDLIKQHVENGIYVRIIDSTRYISQFSSEDLRDQLVVDEQIAGVILLDKSGRFKKVEFSIDPATIKERKSNFDKLLSYSMSYEDWKTTYGVQETLSEGNKAEDATLKK